MSLDDYSLDEYLDPEEGTQEVIRKLAPHGKRLANMIIDVIAGVILQYILIFSMAGLFAFSAEMENDFDEDAFFAMFFPVMFLVYFMPTIYYILMEHFTGKTLGKYLTRTRVVTKTGQKPSIGQIVGRSFARIIPFEPFSFLGSEGIGWHDTLSNTRVIEE